MDVGEFPSSNSPSWRLWLLEFLSTADQLKWNYQKCCQKISESLVAAVFNAFLEAKVSVEVETGDPSVIDVLSRTLAVIVFTRMENLEETFLHQTQQRADENIFVYARRVGAIKTLALKERGNEYWVAICASGLTDKCLRVVTEQPGIAASIGRELEPQDSFVSQLDVLWSKMHQVRLFDAEAQAHEEELTTDQEHSRVVQGDERFQTFRLLTKEKQTGNVADAKGSNAAQCENEETRSQSIAQTNTGRVAKPTSAWKASYWGCEDSEDDSDDTVGEQGGTAHRQPRRSEWCSYSSDEEWSDDEKDEIWSKLNSDDDSYCPYQPLTLEEALKQIKHGKKTRPAGKKTDNPTLHESRYDGMSGPVFGEWIKGGAESLRPAGGVGSGKIRVASVCCERRIQLTDQKSQVSEPNEIRTGSVAVLYWKEAVSREMKVMAVDRVGAYRANMTLERCFSIMIQPCVVEVGIGRVSNQTRETLTLASFRRKKRKKQEPWVPRGVKHKLSWLQPEDSRVNGQDEPASVELRVASGTDISKRQQLPVSWWLWTAWMLMMARLLILESYSLSNRTSTPVTTLCSLVLPSSERWSPSELRRRAEGWLLRNDQTFNEHGWSVTQWRSDETPTCFEYSDRSWIRWKVIPEVGRDYQNALEKQNATSKSSAKVADILWESDALAVNEFRNELRLVPQRAEHVSGVHGKLSWARWKSMPSKSTVSTTLRKITRPAKKSDGQNSIWDSGGAMFKRLGFRTMSTPEVKWVRHPQPAWNTQKRPVSRRVSDSGHCEAGAEVKRNHAVPSADSCSWISHRKHRRWKAKEQAAQNSMKR